jgi:hypothetical protein
VELDAAGVIDPKHAAGVIDPNKREAAEAANVRACQLAGASLSLALDAADTIQAQDGLEKMLVHQMAVLHYGMMRATARMNEELDAAGVIDPNKREAAEAANVRACRLAGAITRMSAT